MEVEMNRPRRASRTIHLEGARLVPITDPAQRRVLDRIFESGKVTKRNRKLLEEARSHAENGRQKS